MLIVEMQKRRLGPRTDVQRKERERLALLLAEAVKREQQRLFFRLFPDGGHAPQRREGSDPRGDMVRKNIRRSLTSTTPIREAC